MKKLALFVSVLAMSLLLLLPTGCSLSDVFSSCSLFGGSDDDENFVGSDTFEGSLSETTYQTNEAAVEGFLETEISGDAVRAELVDFTEKRELDQTQIETLETEDVLEEGDEIVSAKEVVVTYSRTARNTSYSLTAQEYFEFTVYILEISPYGTELHVFRYYVPKAENGDVLTKSYFDDVLDPSKYANCTQEYVNESKVPYSGVSQKIESMTVYQNYTIKAADDKATLYMHAVDTSRWDGGVNVPYTDMYGYFEEVDGDFRIWVSTNGSTYESAPYNPFAMLGITDIKSFASMCLPKLDYSYYEKTSYGFKIQDDFLAEYVSKSLGQLGTQGTVDAKLKLFVQEGKIVQMKSECSITVSNGFQKATSSSNETVTFKDFGMTSVSRPSVIAG